MRRRSSWTPSALAAEALGPLLLLAATALAARAIVWTEWSGRDMQIYATMARFWGDGFIPYRDLYDFKPPLTYVMLRLGFAFWGYEAEGFRRLVLILAALAALLMYTGLRRARQLVAAPVAALGFLTLVWTDPANVVSQNTELLAAIFGAAAFGCAAARAVGSWWWAVASGLCLGLAVMSKQPAILWTPALALQLCLGGGSVRSGSATRQWAAHILALFVGVGIVTGIVLLYFARHGAAGAFLEAIVVDGTRYAGLTNSSPLTILTRPTASLVFGFLKTRSLWPFTASLLLLVPVTIVSPGRWVWVTWAWLATSYLVVVVGPRDEMHYLMAALPALAITAGTVVEHLLPVGGARTSGRLAGSVAISVLLFGVLWRTNVVPRLNDNSSAVAEDAAARTLGARIAALAQPGDTFFMWDEPFVLYLYAGIPPVTRCIYGDGPNDVVNRLCVDAMERKPTFVSIGYETQAKMSHAREGKIGYLERILARDYEVVIADGAFAVVYRRREATDPRSIASPADGGILEWPPRHRDTQRVSVTTLTPTTIEYGFAEPKIDREWNGGAIVMGGVTYHKGLGMHAWTRVTYAVPDGAIGFEARIGLSDAVRHCGTPAVTFEVLDAHNHLLYDSGAIYPQNSPLPIYVALGGTQTITLVLTEGGNGRDCDHANWADPAFIVVRET